MAHKQGFYPTGRQNQLNFNKRWMDVFTMPAPGSGTGSQTVQKWQAWGIPEPTFTDYGETYGNATAALEAVVLSGLREGPLHTAVQETFAALEQLAREIKRRYLFCPPLTAQDMEDLGLKQRDTIRTPQPQPKHAPLLRGNSPERAMIRLTITRPSVADQDLSAFNVIIRIGILAPDGKIPERSPNAAYYMTQPPILPEDCPKQFNRSRKIEDFILSAVESGSTAYVTACFENSKHEMGPWSEIIKIIIT